MTTGQTPGVGGSNKNFRSPKEVKKTGELGDHKVSWLQKGYQQFTNFIQDLLGREYPRPQRPIKQPEDLASHKTNKKTWEKVPGLKTIYEYVIRNKQLKEQNPLNVQLDLMGKDFIEVGLLTSYNKNDEIKNKISTLRKALDDSNKKINELIKQYEQESDSIKGNPQEIIRLLKEKTVKNNERKTKLDFIQKLNDAEKA